MFQSRTKTECELDALSLLYLLLIFIKCFFAMYVSIVYVDIYGCYSCDGDVYVVYSFMQY